VTPATPARAQPVLCCAPPEMAPFTFFFLRGEWHCMDITMQELAFFDAFTCPIGHGVSYLSWTTLEATIPMVLDRSTDGYVSKKKGEIDDHAVCRS
jgi:hypothetical protein